MLFFGLVASIRFQFQVFDGNAAFEIQVLSTSAINAEAISEFSSLPRQYVGKKTAKDSTETFLYYVGNCFGIPRYIAKGYALDS